MGALAAGKCGAVRGAQIIRRPCFGWGGESAGRAVGKGASRPVGDRAACSGGRRPGSKGAAIGGSRPASSRVLGENRLETKRDKAPRVPKGGFRAGVREPAGNPCEMHFPMFGGELRI